MYDATGIRVCIVSMNNMQVRLGMAGDVRYALKDSLSNEENMIPFDGTATLLKSDGLTPASSLAEVATNTRLLAMNGTNLTPATWLYKVFAFTLVGPTNHPEPCWLTLVNGVPLYILARNCHVG